MRISFAPARRAVGTLAIAFALGWLGLALLPSCHDSTAPTPPPAATDWTGVFDAATRTLQWTPPGGTPPLRLEVASVSTDSVHGVVSASVRIHNVGAEPLLGPAGVGVYDFAPASIGAGAGAICDPADVTAPPLPATGCLISHLGTYGDDDRLAAGELSAGVIWSFTGWTGSNFSFHAAFVSGGFAAAGEISGVVYQDLDGDGRRGATEPGLGGIGVALQYTDSLGHQITDSRGHYAFHVTAVGNYLLSKPVTCCAAGARTYAVEIRLRPGGGLTGFSGGDFGCGTGIPSLPHVAFADVRRTGLPACAAAAACTIPSATPFAIRFTGAGACNNITGIQWQSLPPGVVNPEPFQPFGTDSLFLPIGRDTVATLTPGDTLWSVRNDTVTVYESSGSNAGTFVFRARTRDREGLVSVLSEGTLRLTIGFEPETRLQRRAGCDCPTPPVGCTAPDSAALGWITGVDNSDFPLAEWIPFCRGDTLPARSKVRFFVHGRTDPRNVYSGPPAIGYSYRYTWRSQDLDNLNMPFSTAYTAADLPLPGGDIWHGGAVGWQTCSYDYTLYAAAVDDHGMIAGGQLDGTPDSLAFFVSGSPVIDHVSAPLVMILVPSCAGPVDGLCPNPDSLPTFGPDTVVVAGRYRPMPLPGLGADAFKLPIVASGHDAPRDRNASGRNWYTPQHNGAILGWKYTFACAGTGCVDLNLPGEDGWLPDVTHATDPPGEQVFDDSLTLTLPLDTLCTTFPCQASARRVVLPGSVSGPYDVSLQARDWMYEPCMEPSDLGPNPSQFARTPAGRASPVVTRRVILVAWQDVQRPAAPRRAFAWLRRMSH